MNPQPKIPRIEPSKINAIHVILTSTLNWQEATAITFSEHDHFLRTSHVSTYKSIATLAFAKRTFLQDALIYALHRNCLFRSPTPAFPDPLNLLAFDFWDTLKTVKSVDAFYAIAIAKLFRVLMSTRCGHPDGLPWGSHFTYYRELNTLDRHPRGLFERQVLARKNTFPQDDAAGVESERVVAGSAPSVLAMNLLSHASAFFGFLNKLPEDQETTLRAAVLKPLEPESPEILQNLLPIWRAARAESVEVLRVRGGERRVESQQQQLPPLDKLWTRKTNCVYLRNCIDFGDFAAVQLAIDGANLATSKKQYLSNAEASQKPHDQKVARNWWSSGFVKGRFQWNYQKKGGAWQPVPDIRRDLTQVLETIERDETYQSDLLRRDAILKAGKHKAVTRAACQGDSLDALLEQFHNFRKDVIRLFLFMLAAGLNTKLEDCWHRGR